MRILSWNILHGGGTRINDIVSAIESHAPDIVCLQEFRHGKSREPLCDALSKLHFVHQHTPDPGSNIRNTIAIFAKEEISTKNHYRDKNESVRCGEATLESKASKKITILNLSFPHKKEQIPLFETLLELPDHYLEENTIAIGDFNCGIPFEDSETKTFYATHLFQQMLRKGWIDSWRSRNPKLREFTWYSTQKGNGFRYDHALASPKLNSKICRIHYDHSVREKKISDHSLLIVDIDNS